MDTIKGQQPVKHEFTPEEVEAGLQIAHSEYFMQVVALLSYLKDQPELLYSKVPIQTPDGGLYLVSILHIEGPKIQLQKLAQAAELEEKK